MLPLLRFTLDLFSSEPAASQQSPKKRVAKGGVKVPVPPSPSVPRAEVTPGDKPAFVPGALLPGVIDPAHFVHPQANREVRLADAVVAYAFTRAKRKSIGFVIGPDGLVVRAPRWTPLH